MSSLTNRGLLDLLTNGTSGRTFRAALLTANVADGVIRDYNTVSDLASELTAGQVSNYARITVSNVTVTENDGTDTATLTCDALAFGNLAIQGSGANPRMVAIFRRVAGADAGTDPLIGVFEFGNQATGTPTNGAAYTVTIPAGGLSTVSHV
jgi:hypothetical protein